MATVSHVKNPFTNSRDQTLQCYRFLPADGTTVKGVIHYHHGLGDHALRNIEFYKVLTDSGYAVFTFDVHGHGASEPFDERDRVAFDTFQHVLDDALLHLSSVVRPYVQDNFSDAPVFLLGSSMGASASILMAVHPDVGHVQGVILNATAADAVRTTIQKLQEPFAQIANRLIPRAAIIPGLPAEKFMRDPSELALREKDTLLHRGGLKVCTACSMLEAFALIGKQASKLSQPILATHGDSDDVCPLQGVRKLLEDCSSTDKTLKVYPGALHDLLHDFEKHEVRAAMLEWLNARV